jgi:hypothetical protein
MWIFYICALIPVAIGAYLFLQDVEVVWWEWILSSAAAFLLAGVMHMGVISGMTSDVETWSGQIVKVSHHPRWVEEYEESHTRTVGSGEDAHTETYYTTEHETHDEHWVATRDFGSDINESNISHSDFNEIGKKFGGKIFTDGTQSTSHFGGSFDGGDRNIYSINNVTGYMEPVTMTQTFENRIKASPSVFSFSKVPTNINVYPWPDNPDWRHSDRLMGTANVLINHYKWDCLNTSLGPTKKVNLIMVGFGNNGPDYGHWQQSKWIGGKKNDLVITFGGATLTKPAQWAYVFGWTENELVKKNIESLLMENPVNDNLIPLIDKEVRNHYTKKDWHKFDYISITPPGWSYGVYFMLMILTQGGLYYYFHINEYSKRSFRYGQW